MRLLLDTHALAWWLEGSPRLAPGAAAKIANPDNQIWVSAVSAYETSYKHHSGKWEHVGPLVAAFEEIVTTQGFELLPVTARHAVKAGAFGHDHRDPFDRMLVAQAIVEGLALVTKDRELRELGVEVVWG